jgi:hypothetical protein
MGIQTACIVSSLSRSAAITGTSVVAVLLLALPLLVSDADARGKGGGRGGGGGGGFSVGGRGGGAGLAVRSTARAGRSGMAVRSFSGGGQRIVGRSVKPGVKRNLAARSFSPGLSRARHSTRLARSAPGTLMKASAHARPVRLGRARSQLGNRIITNAAFRSSIAAAPLFHGRFHGSHWPWWRGGIVIGWIGPLFWPYAYYDFFDYVFWPHAHDGFWPYAYEDVYYGLYGRYAYVDPAVRKARPRAVRTVGDRRPVVGVCGEAAPELTNWPIERIAETVEPTGPQRAALDELRSATVKSIDLLEKACPKTLPSIPTGRLAAMESRLLVMLQAVATVRTPLDRFYGLLGDEQKARYNAVALADPPAAVGKDKHNFARLCTERGPGVADLPIDRIAQAVHPSDAQRAALEELRNASTKAGEGLKANCPTYRALTPTARVEAMQQRLEAVLEAVRTVKPALDKFYDGLGDEQKARFNTIGASRSGV